MNALAANRFLAVVFLAFILAACGGGGGGGSGGGSSATPAASAMIGAAGGTVTHASGAQVVIPAGALAQDTVISIEETNVGAPPPPSGFTVAGKVFAFTPHGTTFAVPATITVPFDPALVPAGATPTLLKTNAARTAFEPVVSATVNGTGMTAQVSSFSFAEVVIPEPVVIPPLQRNDPVREWEFSEDVGGGIDAITQPLPDSVPDRSGTQVGGQLEKVVNFGPVPEGLEEDLTAFSGTKPSDGQANGMVFGNEDGKTYGVFAEAPYARYSSGAPIGGHARLEQRQSFVKHADDATLTFTLTDIFVCAFDYDSSPLTTVTPDSSRLNTAGASVDFKVAAWTKSGRTFFSIHGHAGLAGSKEDGFSAAALDHGGTQQAWPNFPPEPGTQPAFEESKDELNDTFGNGIRGCLALIGTRTYRVDLSTINKDEEFTLQSVALASADNLRGGGAIGDGRASGAFAYLRDPISMGGSTIEFTGLEPTNRPDAAPPPEVPTAPAACVPGPAPDPAAGVIQFSASAYTVSEAIDAAPVVRVTRSGGSKGAVTATFSTSDGSALAGIDYTAVNRTVFFADGDTQTRTMIVPITPSAAFQPTKTVNLTLSQPGGCVALGAQTTAVLNVEDVQVPPPGPAIFSIGGTVSGLTAGAVRLVLQLPTTGETLFAAANAPFTFEARARSGDNYSVQVGEQPPNHTCTVTNGTGTVGATNVNNIAVNCVATQ